MTETLDRSAIFARAKTTARVPAQRSHVQHAVRPAALDGDLEVIAQHMFSLMLRNVASYGFQFTESNSALEIIRPTCRDLAIDQSPIEVA